MNLINNIPHYSFIEMRNIGLSERTLKSWNYPVKIKHPKDKREAWYNFNELKPKYQAKIKAVLGDPNAKPEFKEPRSILDNYSNKDIELAMARYNMVKQYRQSANSYNAR